MLLVFVMKRFLEGAHLLHQQLQAPCPTAIVELFSWQLCSGAPFFRKGLEAGGIWGVMVPSQPILESSQELQQVDLIPFALADRAFREATELELAGCQKLCRSL
eukprot:TRINITY_DN20367_c0_g1_i2.p1 TRINITY_DN20367_c0_g1~~TRINITY_DN20367_c0_g1_i2.p1  ORF type:complete len:104 (+),score=21.11 TRINITY_DN20367_c0_g1_i2:445-756(+)